MSAETILIADDEATVRIYVRNILRGEGFQILEAVDGLDALQQIRDRHAPVDLLLTDIRMPRMDGIALANSVSQSYPNTAVLYISGYPFDLDEERSRSHIRLCASLAKPFTRKALVDAVRKCLSERESAAGQSG